MGPYLPTIKHDAKVYHVCNPRPIGEAKPWGQRMEQTIGTTELRRRLTDVLSAVREQGATYVVESFDRPLAVLISVEEYQLLLRLRDRQAAARTVEEVQAFVDALYRHRKPEGMVDDLIADRRREHAQS